MVFKESFAIILVIITTAGASSATVLLPPANKNAIVDTAKHSNGMEIFLKGILKSFNWSRIQDDVIEKAPNDLEQLVNHQPDADLLEHDKSLAFLFRKSIATNWQTKNALQVIASAANDVTVYEILYEVLWQELRSDHNKTSPLFYLELYEDLDSVLANITSKKLRKLHEQIQMDLEKCSAAVLQSFFIQRTTIGQLLLQLKNFDNLYQRTIPRVFENLNHIEDQWQTAKALLDFDSNTEEAVFNHISFLKYLQSRHEVIPYELYNNLERLIARQNFVVSVSEQERQLAAQLLPLSMGGLFATHKICIRNTTTNLYLYECPQTYLMCTNVVANNTDAVNRKKAVFELERIGKGQYFLRSPYWSRYLRLQISNVKNDSSIVAGTRPDPITNNTITKVTKNIYSSPETSPWFIRFRGDFATIQDPTGQFYVCGGNPLYWSEMEKHAYTRQAMSSNEIQEECLWLLEDCSDVAA